jgi:alpha-beta hydrolase superfamily lysophospholipase
MNQQYSGRDLTPPFLDYRFSSQIEQIKSDILTSHWNKDAILIGKSYGGYLLMHALCEFEDVFPGKVLLFSPVLGRALDPMGKMTIRPPRGDKLRQLALNGELPQIDIEVDTGSKDMACDPMLAKEIIDSMTTGKITIIEGAGHELGFDYICGVISSNIEA